MTEFSVGIELYLIRESSLGVVANLLDGNIVVSSNFSRTTSYTYCVDFRTFTLWKDINCLIPSVMYLIVPLLPIYKDDFGIK